MISLILGNVGYGKTTSMVRIYNELVSSTNMLYFRPAADIRTLNDRAITHNGEEVPAITIRSINDIHDINLEGVDVIFIDDLHYFEDKFQLDSLKDLTIGGIDIYCTARDIDDEGDPYEHVGYMACMADSVMKLIRTCDNCGRACRYSYCNAFTNGLDPFVTDLDQYDSLCEVCFYERMGNDIFEDHIDVADESGQSVEITIHTEDGEVIRFNISPDVVEKAGWTLEEIRDINSTEGVERLFSDIRYVGGYE